MDLGVREQSYVMVGGSSGIGWETACLLAAEGANVAILSRSPETIASKVEDLARQYGVRALAIAADVAGPDDLDRAIGYAVAALGPPRGLAVTNHWMTANGSFAAMADVDWDMFHQNSLMGAVRACRAVLPHMTANGGGTIVLTSAYSSRAPKPFIAGYAVFKAAINNLTKVLAKSYGAQGVRVNAVAPGAVKTGRYDARLAAMIAQDPSLSPAAAEREMLSQMGMTVALGRIGERSEVADMIAFLLSERAAYTTGLIANVDGGTDF
jgi:NAD(P)-dependent dehydrogenase (short-subunit alcohol dehydrogenase family)